MTFLDLLKNFFTHKDFLPPANEIPGTMFTPLHIIVSVALFAVIVVLGIFISKKSDKVWKIITFVLWIILVIAEPTKILWETFTGREVSVFWQGILPLYPCSMFMYVMPFYIFGKGLVKHAACGYITTLGLVGALVNFVYPATVISTYSCISFAGFHTLFYHGSMLFVALVIMLRGDNRFTGVDSLKKLLVPAIPVLIFSIPVNIVNFTIGADYMFFKCDSFFLKPIGDATPDIVTVIMMYAIYIAIHILPFLPSYIKLSKKRKNL